MTIRIMQWNYSINEASIVSGVRQKSSLITACAFSPKSCVIACPLHALGVCGAYNVFLRLTMLRIATISTRGFLSQTRRLLRSLETSNDSFTLAVYCDDAKSFEPLAGARCNVIELPSIRKIGVKRARFDLYRRAIQTGEFLYLDSDIIVLEPLSELTGSDVIAACPDDLSACPFIPEKRHPWPGDPALENRVYVNSGVLVFPVSAGSFIDLLWRNSQRDDLWRRYIIEGKLHDNHFLCAYLNLENQPLRLLDEFRYNWQGFLKNGKLLVERRGSSLINPSTRKKLSLVHFAGIRDVDACLRSLPASVSDLLIERTGESPDSFLATDAVPSCDVNIAILDAPSHAVGAEEFKVSLRIMNRSDLPLSSHYLHPIFISYHWFGSDGRCLVFDGLRTSLPFSVHPGDSATFDARILAPDVDARSICTLSVTLVQEGIHWFDHKNIDARSCQAVEVAPLADGCLGEGRHTCRLQPQNQEDSAPLVRLCYSAVLNRPPRDDEFQASVTALASGSGADWLRGLLRSEEFSRSYLAAAGIITGDITGDDAFLKIYETCRAYTITSMERVYAFYQAVEHVIGQGLPGDIVECGVWRGGSCMTAAYTLLAHGETSRNIYLYDTFSGMSQPGDEDVRFDGARAGPIWRDAGGASRGSSWWNCSLAEVRGNLLTTGYPPEKLVFVQGQVEHTLCDVIPDQIAILRLDTDWYESTLAELRYLYPRLIRGGILIIDDYGWWAGSRRAVTEYFAQNGIRMLLTRIDGCGARMGIKQ